MIENKSFSEIKSKRNNDQQLIDKQTEGEVNKTVIEESNSTILPSLNLRDSLLLESVNGTAIS